MTPTDAPSDTAAPWDPVPGDEFLRLLLQTGFSPTAYRDRYADLVQRNISGSEAVSHFLSHGLSERRAAGLKPDLAALVALSQLPIRDVAFKAQLMTCLGYGLFDDIDHPHGAAIQSMWHGVRAMMDQGAKPFFLVGDSHSNAFRIMGTRGGTWLLPIPILCTGGSVAELADPTARSGYGGQLRRSVQFIETLFRIETVPLLVRFGQFDLEFAHHFQRARDGLRDLDLSAYRDFCKRTVARYMRFLTALAARLHIVVVSVFPPVLSDEAWRQGLVNDDVLRQDADMPPTTMSEMLRGIQVASLSQRTEMHLYFNGLLHAACQSHGFGYVDSATPFLAPDGLVAPRFVAPETPGNEHHLDERQTYAEVSLLIWDAIDRVGART